MVEDEVRTSRSRRGLGLLALMALGAVIATGVIFVRLQDARGPGSAAFPLRVDPTGRFVVDQFGAPWPLVGDAAWSIIGTLTPAQVTWYLDQLEAHGINAILVSLIEGYYSENAPNTKAGDPPYVGDMFQSKPNPAYWAFVDDLVSEAAARGITILAVPLYVGWGDDGIGTQTLAASESQIEAYGEFLAQRYESSPNIIWVIGGDKGSINDPGNARYKKRFEIACHRPAKPLQPPDHRPRSPRPVHDLLGLASFLARPGQHLHLHARRRRRSPGDRRRVALARHPVLLDGRNL